MVTDLIGKVKFQITGKYTALMDLFMVDTSGAISPSDYFFVMKNGVVRPIHIAEVV